MKKRSWLAAKFTFVLLSFFAMYGFGLWDLSAQPRKDDRCSRQACGSSMIFWCHCGDADCGGCYIPNGSGGCGTCR